MKYKKSEITIFAKNCAWGANQMLNGICVASDISHSEIGKDFRNKDDEELLIEVSKRFAKYAKDEIGFDVDNGEVQTFQYIIDSIIECCEEKNWFR